MYLLRPDVELLIDRLDSDEEVAWLVARGPNQWGAQVRHPLLDRGCYGLWHVPSGPLPLLASYEDDADDGLIDDPWSGWSEECPGADPRIPYFGAGHPGVYWLNLPTSQRPRGKIDISMSSVGWIGNYFRPIGRGADKATERHWRRFRYWVKEHACPIPRIGRVNGPRPEIYAFPAALSAIKAGATRAINPGE
jgi:hypothetical protein